LGKRNIFIIVIVLLFIISGFISYKVYSNKHTGFDIEIKNSTGLSIRGLAITYKGIVKDIELPEIEEGKIYKLNINPKEYFSENSMIIYYRDKRGYTQRNTLIGYFEKGYNGKVNVNINSQDKNGLLIMQVQEKI
jgi:hypothetical protein